MRLAEGQIGTFPDRGLELQIFITTTSYINDNGVACIIYHGANVMGRTQE